MHAFRLHLYIWCLALALPCVAGAAPTLPEALDSAWQRSTPGRTQDARQQEADATRAAAASWVAGSPMIGLGQRSDRWTGGRGMRESELSVSTPIWLPGQHAARGAFAARSAEDLQAQTLHERLILAGQVRTRMWEAAAAQESLEEQRDHLHHLEELRDAVKRRVKAGDLARSDGLLAEQEVLAATVAVTQARTRAFDAMARYRTLTGQAELPPLVPEPLADAAASLNPRLAAARAAERRAQAALRLSEATRAGAPSVALSVRREQGSALLRPERSIGVALQIPIGGRTRNRPAEAQAQVQIAGAAAEAAQAEASLEAGLAVANEQLANVRAAVEAAGARAQALREHTALIGKAFRLGERELAELLRSRALSHEAEVALRQQRVALGMAHAQHNQARGILP